MCKLGLKMVLGKMPSNHETSTELIGTELRQVARKNSKGSRARERSVTNEMYQQDKAGTVSFGTQAGQAQSIGKRKCSVGSAR